MKGKSVWLWSRRKATAKLTMQVTAVKKALLSVSNVCDACQEAVFTRFGGRIRHSGTGQGLRFKSADGVYRLRLRVASEHALGFQRQGL